MRKSLGELINTALSDADSALKLASARDAEIRSSGDFLDAELVATKLAAEDSFSEKEREGTKKLVEKHERKMHGEEKGEKEEASEKKSSRSDFLGAASYAMKLAEALEIGAHVVAKVSADTDPNTHEQRVTVSTGGAGASPLRAPGPQVMASGFIGAQTIQPKAQSAGAERITGPTTTAGNMPTSIADHTGNLDGEQPPNNTGKTAAAESPSFQRGVKVQSSVVRSPAETAALRSHFQETRARQAAEAMRAPVKQLPETLPASQFQRAQRASTPSAAYKNLEAALKGRQPTSMFQRAGNVVRKFLKKGSDDSYDSYESFTRSKEASARLLRAKQAQAETLMRMGQIKEAERLLAEVEKAAQDPSSPGPELPAHSNSYMLSTEPGDSTMIPDNAGLISMNKAQAKDRSVRTATEYVHEQPKLDNAVAAHALSTQGQKVSSLIVDAVEKVALNRSTLVSAGQKLGLIGGERAEKAFARSALRHQRMTARSADELKKGLVEYQTHSPSWRRAVGETDFRAAIIAGRDAAKAGVKG